MMIHLLMQAIWLEKVPIWMFDMPNFDAEPILLLWNVQGVEAGSWGKIPEQLAVENLELSINIFPRLEFTLTSDGDSFTYIAIVSGLCVRVSAQSLLTTPLHLPNDLELLCTLPSSNHASSIGVTIACDIRQHWIVCAITRSLEQYQASLLSALTYGIRKIEDDRECKPF